MSVRGRDMVTGLPATFSVTSEDCRVALEDAVASMIATVRGVLEKCPPELASDIVDNGIYLTGGGALLDGLAEVMQAETGIDIHIAENPLDCVAIGTGKALQSLDKLHPGAIYTSSNLV
jgi:rod shape-determining protein MreB